MEEDNDEDEEKKKEVDFEKEARKKMKEILGGIESYIKTSFKLFECKVTEKSKVKEIETKLDSFLTKNLFHTHFLQESETLKIHIYGEIDEATDKKLRNTLQQLDHMHVDTFTYENLFMNGFKNNKDGVTKVQQFIAKFMEDPDNSKNIIEMDVEEKKKNCFDGVFKVVFRGEQSKEKKNETFEAIEEFVKAEIEDFLIKKLV